MIRNNEGGWDRGLRIAIGLVMLYLWMGEVATGAAGTASWVVAVVLLLTGVIGWCPLYALLKLDTRRRDKEGIAIN